MARPLKRKSIDFDEAISDSATSHFGFKELPLNRRVFRITTYFTVFLAAVIVVRTTFLGGLSQAYYSNLALGNIHQETVMIAPRGLITDRYGKPLVTNEISFNVRLAIPTMMKNKEAEQVFKVVDEILGLTKEEVLSLIASSNLEHAPEITLKRDTDLKQAIKLKSLNLKSLYVENSYKRVYPSPALAHVTGFVGFSKEDNFLKGRAGLEAYYDQLLRGEDGKQFIYQDARGNVLETKVLSSPKQGAELKTTLDYEFQEYFYNRLQQGLKSLDRIVGVGIALNPKNGEILALVSLPAFDPNKVADSLALPGRPFFNRAVSGLYNPGSTIKPLHAVAVLKENIVPPSYQIFSPGFIEIPNPYFPDKPSRFLDWRPNGWVDVYSALAKSSNIYFYETVGGFENLQGLGIVKLKSYWEKFGLGQITGIDLPSEAAGYLPDPQQKETKTGFPWRIGDTYNVAIGQGDILVTPLQLLNAIAAIANNGLAYKPHLKMGETELKINITDLAKELNEVKRGMAEAVSKQYGTAHMLADLPFKVAAKTGSAQIANNTKTNALVVGFGPIDEPEIAILVLIEDAREGSLNAVPIAKDIFRWYYDHRLNERK